MSFQRQTLCLGLATLISHLIVGQTDAQLRFPKLGPNRQARPIPQRQQEVPMELSENAGPWLIMCASFAGDGAEVQAMQLAQELRANRLQAYVYSHHFDFSGTIEGLEYDPSEEATIRGADGQMYPLPKRMKVNAPEAEFDEYAVLVGDFPSIEDAHAQETLQQIKYMMPETLGQVAQVQYSNGELAYEAPETSNTQRFRLLRTVNRTVNANADKQKGPMGAAFLVANPTLPEEYFSAYRVDEFVLNMNRGIRHSLLDNPGKYSVRIATFGGDATFELNEMEEQHRKHRWRLRNGKSITESKLALAIARANRLTRELRRLGVPAYEFHDRVESYVCIGEFDWLKRTEGGVEVQNPEIVEMIELFKGSIENFPGIQGAVRPKTLHDIAESLELNPRKIPDLGRYGIVFDVQPVPVQVPRAPIGVARSRQ